MTKQYEGKETIDCTVTMSRLFQYWIIVHFTGFNTLYYHIYCNIL